MSRDEWPFLGRQAVRRGEILAWQLRRDYRPVYRNVYLSKQATLTALNRARAAWLWSGGDTTLTGISAAAVLGTKWLDVGGPAELCRPNRHGPPGIVIRSYALDSRETCVRTGIRITTPARTAFDIGRSLPAARSIPILDALANATSFKVADVVALAAAKPGSRNIRRLRRVLTLVDGGAESPQESRVRLLLVNAGLPPPETQIEFADESGLARIRVDMGWREWRVAVEYDGVQHWSDRYQRSWDIDRIAMLEAIGWAVVRISAEMLTRPEVIIERVRGKLQAAGCPIQRRVCSL
jgi:very-short-patch-repair endonuclease